MNHHLGENRIKGAKGAKVKFLLQGLHMTHVTFVLIYNFKFCILDI
jgi:heme/copper-type cytochrome/quinol oxidase subunit 3